MSTLSQWFGDAGQSIGDDVLGTVTDSLGLPTLPPLSISPPNTNPNNYVQPRPAPVQPTAAETQNSAVALKQKYMKYGAIAAGVLLVIYFVTHRRK